LIDLRLFKLPAFSVSLATYTLATFVAFGVFVFISQYLQLVLGLSPLRAGVWTAPFAAAFIIGSMLTPAIVRRVRPAIVTVGGLLLAAVGFVMVSRVGSSGGLLLLVAGFVVYSLGLAPVFTLATDMIVGSAPPERAGAAAAISETGSELGGALGIAILGSIGTAIYRGGMAETLRSGVPFEIAEAARGTLGGAIVVAARLPSQVGSELVTTARAAFSQALDVTALISAAVALATAILVASSSDRAA
jgi:DHA2 family multidrug resistance protein-like MFS transporter